MAKTSDFFNSSIDTDYLIVRYYNRYKLISYNTAVDLTKKMFHMKTRKRAKYKFDKLVLLYP